MFEACIFMTAIETLRSDVDGLTNTKQLLNLLSGMRTVSHSQSGKYVD